MSGKSKNAGLGPEECRLYEVKTQKMIERAILKLIEYCARNNWSGFDPYDGLNSRFFSFLPFAQNKVGRLLFSQLMKRSPINLRPVLFVPKQQNPKGLALFISALSKLPNLDLMNVDDIISLLLSRLIELKSPQNPYFCWGYNFDWQARNFLALKGTPNVICTTFVGNALLDAYELRQDTSCLNMAVSAGHFLLQGLNIARTKDGLCFSYTPYDHEQIHNANLLSAAFLARLYSTTAEKLFLEYAHSAVKFSVARQAGDGSWPYGVGQTQTWIDNFHTGYNLIALKLFCRYAKTQDFLPNIKKGFQFYRDHFFTREGIPQYYHNRLYPIDIHSVAQSIITLLEFSDLNVDNINLALSICRWACKDMTGNEGYFYYQKGRFFKNRIPYMRWSQAWMLYALVRLRETLTSLQMKETKSALSFSKRFYHATILTNDGFFN